MTISGGSINNAMDSYSLEDKLAVRQQEWVNLKQLQCDPNRFDEWVEYLQSSLSSTEITHTDDITLSRGLPSDGFAIETNNNNEIKSIYYWLSDLSGYKERELNFNEKQDFVSAYCDVLQRYGLRC